MPVICIQLTSNVDLTVPDTVDPEDYVNSLTARERVARAILQNEVGLEIDEEATFERNHDEDE